MTESKNQDLIVWILGRVRNLLKETTEQSKIQIAELMEMVRKLLPEEEANLLLQSIKNMMNGAPVEQQHQKMHQDLILSLRESLKDWKISIRHESEPGPMVLGRNAVLPGKMQWYVSATKDSPAELPTLGTHSMQMELASQNHSLNDAIEQILKQHKELKDLGLD